MQRMPYLAMGIIQRFRDIFTRTETTPATEPAAPKEQAAEAGRLPWYYYYDKLTAGSGDSLAVATVYRCVALLCGSVAQLSLQYKRRKGTVFVEDTTSRLNYLLNVEPNETMTAFDMKQGIVAQYLLQGNAYIVPMYNPWTMDWDRLVLCSRGSVTHDTDRDLYIVSDSINGLSGTYAEEEIIHIKNLTTKNPKVGVSVLTHARETLDITHSGSAEILKRFREGGNPRGFLSNAIEGRGLDGYDEEELEKAAQKLQQLMRRNDSSVYPLPYESKYISMAMTSADMQFVECMKLSLRDVCRFFGVHPSFVFDDTSNNYKSAEMANTAFLSNTLNPLLLRIENELQRKLIGMSGFGKRRIEFDRRDIYALDLDSKANYYAKMIACGAWSVNDVRALEGMPPVENGDATFVSANLKSLQEAINGNTNNNGIEI